MTYSTIMHPGIHVGTIVLNTSGVSVSLSSPKVAITSIDWGTSTQGTASIDSNNIVLSANKKYLLQATVSYSFSATFSDDYKIRFYDETNSSWLGKHGVLTSSYEAFGSIELTRTDDAARAIIINGSSARNVSLKYSGTTDQTFTIGDKPASGIWTYLTAYGRIEVWEF
ncbi:hypothetical protein CL614_05670 [archaeon]|nr:hypothetical protein [archaeon]|tara:strand:+ start:2341 stop:2847 length:507 start_codon:yes stop_codon:yes gene_type:complete